MTTILTRVPVTVEKTAAGRFVARAEAEGGTAEEAVAKLRAEVQPAPAPPLQSMTAGDDPNPWLALAGAFKDDSLVDDWLEVMADLRNREDAVPEMS